MSFDVRYVRGHVEVYGPEGQFLLSADTEREARTELRELFPPNDL